MSIELSSLSATDLEALISKAEKRKAVLKTRKSVADVREKLAKIAKRENYTLAEIFPGQDASPASLSAKAAKAAKPSRKSAAKGRATPVSKAVKATKAGGTVPPKYQNPENPDETWSGRGVSPRWLKAYLDQGRQKDEFLIGATKAD